MGQLSRNSVRGPSGPTSESIPSDFSLCLNIITNSLSLEIGKPRIPSNRFKVSTLNNSCLVTRTLPLHLIEAQKDNFLRHLIPPFLSTPENKSTHRFDDSKIAVGIFTVSAIESNLASRVASDSQPGMQIPGRQNSPSVMCYITG